MPQFADTMILESHNSSARDLTIDEKLNLLIESVIKNTTLLTEILNERKEIQQET